MDHSLLPLKIRYNGQTTWVLGNPRFWEIILCRRHGSLYWTLEQTCKPAVETKLKNYSVLKLRRKYNIEIFFRPQSWLTQHPNVVLFRGCFQPPGGFHWWKLDSRLYYYNSPEPVNSTGTWPGCQFTNPCIRWPTLQAIIVSWGWIYVRIWPMNLQFPLAHAGNLQTIACSFE